MLLNFIIITGKKISNKRNKYFKDSFKKLDAPSAQGLYIEVINYIYGISVDTYYSGRDTGGAGGAIAPPLFH